MIGEVHAVTNPALDVLNTDTNFRSVVCCGAVTAFVPVSDAPSPSTTLDELIVSSAP